MLVLLTAILYFMLSLLLGYVKGKIASEATKNIRTVASLTREETIFTLYRKELVQPLK